MSHSMQMIVLAVVIGLAAGAGCARPPQSVAAVACSGAMQPCDHRTTGSIAGDLSRESTRRTDLSLPPPSLGFVDTLTNTNEVQAAIARTDAASAEISAARSMVMPQVSLNASTNAINARREPFEGDEPNNSYSYSLSVDIPIYQGGRDRSALNVAKSEYRASIESAKDVLTSTALALISAQAQVERQNAVIDILDRNRRALKVLRGNVLGERDAGTASNVDVGEVDRQSLRLDIDRRQAALQRVDAQETLLRLNAAQTMKIVGPDAVAARLPKDLPSLIELALGNNPRVAQRTAQVDAAEARIEQARAAYNPNVSLALSGVVQGTPSASTDRYRDTSAVLRLQVPIYSGGAREAGVERRSADYLATALDRDSALQGVSAAVTTAYRRRDEARDMLALAKRQQRVTRAQIAGVRIERKLGERTVFDEIRAIGDTAQAETDIVSATYDYAIAQYILAAETGILAEMMGVKIDHAPRASATATASLK